MSRAGKTNYSKETKAAALALVPILGTQLKAAEALGISHDTVSRASRDPEITKLANLKKQPLADILEEVVRTAAAAILNDAPNAKLRDALAICQLTDKMLLLRGEANSITRQIGDLSPEERRARLSEIIEAVREKKTA